MKLNQEQITQLFSFTKQHYVEYYDLQLELVDHLADGIELAMSESASLTFEQALHLEFKKFGIFGFMDVIEKRQAALTKKYHLLVWKHLKGFFRLPKIIGSAFAIAAIYYLLVRFYASEELFISAFAVIVVLNLTSIFWRKRNPGKTETKDQKRWLFKEIISRYGNFSAFAIFPMQLLNLFYNRQYDLAQNHILVLIFSIMLVLYALFTYIIIFVIPSKATEYVRETYPEYELTDV